MRPGSLNEEILAEGFYVCMGAKAMPAPTAILTNSMTSEIPGTPLFCAKASRKSPGASEKSLEKPSSKISGDSGYLSASQVTLVVKNSPAKAGDLRDSVFIPESGKIPWRRTWQPTPVFLPRKFHGQRSLVGSVGLQRVRHN